MQPAKKDLERRHPAGIGFGAARYAALVEQPIQEVVEVFGADFADRLADAQVFSQQTYVAGKGFARVEGKTFVAHVVFKFTQRRLKRGVTG